MRALAPLRPLRRLAPFVLAASACAAGSAAAPRASTVPAVSPQSPSAPKAPAKEGSSGEPAFVEVARSAAQAHQDKRLEEAVELYRQGLEMRPKWTEGRFGLGGALYELDRFTEARVAFRRVLVDAPESAPALAMAGLCSFRLKEYETALAEIQRGREVGLGDNPDLQAIASYHVAILLIRFGRFEVAYEALRDFALRDRDSPGVIEAFGLSLLRLPYLPSEAPIEKREMILMAGRAGYQLARGLRSPATRRTFEVLVQRYPEEPNIRYAWGVFLLQNEPDAGLVEFRRALSLDPGHVPAMCQIALQMIKEGRYEEALPTAELAAETGPQNFVARNVLGRTLLELGQLDRAIEELEAAARLAPDSPQMFFHLARAYQRAGRKAEANEARVTFLKLDRASRERTPAGEARSSEEEAPPD